MTDLRTAAQQALDFIVATNKSSQFWLVPDSNLNKTVTALRAALAEPVQKPVAWMTHGNDRLPLFHKTEAGALAWGAEPLPLYTTPPQRKKDAEWRELDGAAGPMFKRVLRKFARAIERAHGIGDGIKTS